MATPADQGVGVRGDGVVAGGLRDPGPHAGGFEQLADQLLELDWLEGQEVMMAVEARDDVHLFDELVRGQIEVDDWSDGFEVVEVGDTIALRCTGTAAVPTQPAVQLLAVGVFARGDRSSFFVLMYP